jgi:uncharacterized lipoprotein
MKSSGKVILIVLAAGLAGCTSSNRTEGEKYQGREESKKLQGADAAGYDGTAVRKTVDNALDKNDAHNAGLEKTKEEEK